MHYEKIFFVLLLVTSACGALNTKSNINGGFENAVDEIAPDGWSANKLPQIKKYAEFSLDNSVSHGGNKSIKISILKNHPSQSIIYNWVRRLDGLNVGETYELRCWVKLMNIKITPFLNIEFWNNDLSIGSASTSKKILNVKNNSWQLIKTVFFVPQATTKIILSAGINGMNNNGGIVWFDDLTISMISNN